MHLIFKLANFSITIESRCSLAKNLFKHKQRRLNFNYRELNNGRKDRELNKASNCREFKVR